MTLLRQSDSSSIAVKACSQPPDVTVVGVGVSNVADILAVKAQHCGPHLTRKTGQCADNATKTSKMSHLSCADVCHTEHELEDAIAACNNG